MKKNIESLAELTVEDDLDLFVRALCALHSVDPVRADSVMLLLQEHTHTELESQHEVRAKIAELVSDTASQARWWLKVFDLW